MNRECPVVSLERVSFRYAPSDPLVLADVHVALLKRSITALLGPNGSGKSTLLHLILGLLTPVQGQICLMGRPLQKYSRRECSKILGLVPQDEQVAFDLSVLEYVLLGRAPYLNLLDRPGGKDHRIAREALATVGLAALQNRLVPSLSGGERQLATVARALAQETEVLLLDEPTSHLDLGNARRILAGLRALKASGKTIVLTTHDPNAAAAIADHVILLRGGQVLSSGTTEEVMTSEQLSAAYGVNVEVMQVHDRRWVLTHASPNDLRSDFECIQETN